MRKSIIFLTMVGLISLLTYCKKDETRAVLSVSPIAPTLTTVPDLTLKRTNGIDTLLFVGTPVNPGFIASANYYLEVDTAGDKFANPIVLTSDVQDAAFKFSVSDFNGLLIKRFPTDTVSSLEFRIRSVLVDDAVTVGVSLVSVSATKAVSVTTYGLPRLDLLGSGITQKVESPLGDGNYSGYVKLDPTKPFTLRDPDANIVYGANGTALAANGTAISVSAAGWYQVSVNTKALTYSVLKYMPSIVGAFTNWGAGYTGIPGDYFMDYNAKLGYWYITLALPAGEMKFRLNADWGTNWGPNGSLSGSDAALPANGGTLNLPNSSGNVVITTAGTYFVTLTINGSAAVSTFVLSN